MYEIDMLLYIQYIATANYIASRQTSGGRNRSPIIGCIIRCRYGSYSLKFYGQTCRMIEAFSVLQVKVKMRLRAIA